MKSLRIRDTTFIKGLKKSWSETSYGQTFYKIYISPYAVLKIIYFVLGTLSTGMASLDYSQFFSEKTLSSNKALKLRSQDEI